MRADNNDFVFQSGIGAIENTDDVGRLHFAADDVGRKCYEHGLYRRSNRLILVLVCRFIT